MKSKKIINKGINRIGIIGMLVVSIIYQFKLFPVAAYPFSFSTRLAYGIVFFLFWLLMWEIYVFAMNSFYKNRSFTAQNLKESFINGVVFLVSWAYWLAPIFGYGIYLLASGKFPVDDSYVLLSLIFYLFPIVLIGLVIIVFSLLHWVKAGFKKEGH